jgi:hypothetical protein
MNSTSAYRHHLCDCLVPTNQGGTAKKMLGIDSWSDEKTASHHLAVTL